MQRGSTPTLVFTLPVETDNIVECWVTIAQSGKVLINHTIAQCVKDGNKIKTGLSQKETLLLSEDDLCEIQLRVKFSDGNAFPSQIFTEPVSRVLRDGEI